MCMKSPHNQEFKILMQQLRAMARSSPTYKALKEKALALVEPFVNNLSSKSPYMIDDGRPVRDKVWKYSIDGFADVDKDEYWEVDEWIKSTEFVLWILKDKAVSKQLHKDCVWELLKG